MKSFKLGIVFFLLISQSMFAVESGLKKQTHAGAADGLTRIDENGVYIYDIKNPLKNESSHIRMGSAENPKITIDITALDGSTTAVTFDDIYEGASKLTLAVAPGEVVTVPVTGRAGVPGAAVGAVLLNLTATEVRSPSFATGWPTGQPRPWASNVNMGSDDTVANLVLVPPGADGTVSVYQHAGPADLVVDAVGWFAADSDVRSVTPVRLLDTRAGDAPTERGEPGRPRIRSARPGGDRG